jgi:hypothetical protein
MDMASPRRDAPKTLRFFSFIGTTTLTSSDNPAPLELLTEALNQAYATGAQVGADGALHLQMEEGLAVSIAASPDQQDLVFYTHMADLLQGRSVALMAAALAANLHQDLTRGGAMAVDLASQTLFFNWRMGVQNRSIEDLVGALENFCVTSTELRDHLAQAVSTFSDEQLDEMDRRAKLDEALTEPMALDYKGDNATNPVLIIKG